MKTSFIIRLVAAIVLVTLGCIGFAEGLSVAVVLFSISSLLLIPYEQFTRPIPRREWKWTFLLVGAFLAVMLTLPFLRLNLRRPSQSVRITIAVLMWLLGMWGFYCRWQREKRTS